MITMVIYQWSVIGRDGHLDQSHVNDILGQVNGEYPPDLPPGRRSMIPIALHKNEP